MTGYLKALSNKQPFGDGYMCEVAIPNKEILSKFENVIPPAAVIAVQEAIFRMDITKLKNKLETYGIINV